VLLIPAASQPPLQARDARAAAPSVAKSRRRATDHRVLPKSPILGRPATFQESRPGYCRCAGRIRSALDPRRHSAIRFGSRNSHSMRFKRRSSRVFQEAWLVIVEPINA
jgi:hypothetical protein